MPQWCGIRSIHDHSRPDDFHVRIRAYSSEEIVAEKIRALFERTRPRDLYDVWRLHNEIDDGKVLNILYKKCMVKDVKIDVRSLEDRRDNFANAWTNSLRHQIKALPDFDDVFCEVKGTPGFTAVFMIAGMLAVAYAMMRRRS